MEVNRAAESTFPAFEAHGEIRVQNNSPLSHAVAALNTARVFGEQDELTFAIDRSSKRVVIRLVDKETRQVIRQLPPESVLRMAEDLAKTD